MNIMKKRNIFLGLVLMLGLTGCYDLDKMPEGVLSTTIPFASTGEMRNYLDQFYQTGNYKYDYVSFGDGMRAQGFDAGVDNILPGQIHIVIIWLPVRLVPVWQVKRH